MEIPADLNLRKDVPLGDFTTWKVGGAADFFAEPESSEQLFCAASQITICPASGITLDGKQLTGDHSEINFRVRRLRH